MSQKIALIGSAPSSVRLAPYNDPEWQIWGCSPGAIPHVTRADLWFEIHAMNDQNRPCCNPEYLKRVNALNCPVMMIDKDPRLPRSEVYPVEEMLREFGPWCWGSSLSYMFALAIHQKPEVIGLWGVDMSANEEYAGQRPTLHMLIDKAQDRGIEVTTPMESDLLRPTPMYGYREVDPAYVKMRERVKELNARKADAENRFENAKSEITFLNGALDDLHYTLRTWVYERPQIDYALHPALRRSRTEDQIRQDLLAEFATEAKKTKVEPYVDKYVPQYENGADAEV